MNLNLTTYDLQLTSSNIQNFIKNLQPHIIIHPIHNFKIPYLINQVSHNYQIPWLYAPPLRTKPSLYPIDHQPPSLKSLFQTIPHTPQTSPINPLIPPLISIIPTYQLPHPLPYLSPKPFSNQLITI
ncbi:ThiF family adenylyltransferase, partial [Staphylococcus epidermidis]|uniref:ThiF family adenylyltransferase n=1 Tax=Staphylococcus epidermidis TaxID=1282 RepID=UPI0037DA599D